jgi:hypothetical protein
MLNMKYFLPLTIALFLFSNGLFSQNAVIEGIITDAKTKETLVGAQVLIYGTTLGTMANLNGEYRITNVPEGTISLHVFFISYEPMIIENIKVERGRTLTINVALNEVHQVLEGVTVTARRTTYTETSLIQSIRNSQVVTSGISAQQIRRSQDSDAAQVVRRIPGITIIDDRFIVVRGLSERYNTTWLHNTVAPSMEPDSRSFSFDMIPSSQIDHLLVFKSPSPDLPGDFAGGAIKIFTRSIPDQSGLEISYTSQYDQGTSFKPFYGTQKSSLGWTGFGQEYFDLPSEFPNDLRTITNNPDALQNAGRSLKNNWVPEQHNALLNHNGAITGSLRWDKRNIRIGNITTMTFSNTKSLNNVFRADYNAYNHIQNISLPIYNFEDARFSNSIKLGVLHNWGIEIGNKHSFEIINFYNNISSYSYTNRIGDHIDFGFAMNYHAFQQIFRGLYSGQITGKHELTQTTRIDWTVGLNNSFRGMPDYRQYRTDKPLNDVDGDKFYTYLPIGGAQPYFLGRFYSGLKGKVSTRGQQSYKSHFSEGVGFW